MMRRSWAWFRTQSIKTQVIITIVSIGIAYLILHAPS